MTAPSKPKSQNYFQEGEIAERLKRLASANDAKSSRTDALNSYRQAASVLVAFRLDDLAPAFDVAGEYAARYLLGQETVPSPYLEQRDKFPLTLMVPTRKKALREIQTRDGLKAALAANSQRPGSYLQKLFIEAIEGRQFDLSKLQIDGLTALATVSDWLEGTEPGEALPPASEVRWEIERRRHGETLRRLAGDSFTGRQNESELVLKHLASREPGLLVIHGAGGTGKSALISNVLLTWSNSSPGAENAPSKRSWVRIDLDHSFVKPEDPITILQEAANHLMRQYPEFESLFSDFIGHACATVARRDLAQLENVSSADSSGEGLVYQFISALKPVTQPPDGTLVFWVDTFEEAQFLGGAVIHRLLHLLQTLATALPAVRVIISGRAPLNQTQDDQSAQNGTGATHLALGDLPEEPARDLLQKLVIISGRSQASPSPESIARAVAAIGGNPLTLCLAAPLLALEPELDDKILSTVRKETLQRRLFSRFQSHIRNPAVRKLVMPGLIVRRITPDVIRYVLAKPCGLGNLDATQARMLLADLGKEITLIEKEGDDLLRYRQDVRLVMIPGMPADFESLAKQIDINAVSYWAGLSGPIAAAEEIYHRLRLRQSPITLSKHLRAEPGVGQLLRSALEELPPGSVQRGWLATRLDASLDANETVGIGQPEWEKQTALEVARLLLDGKPRAALDLLGQRATRLPGSQLYALESRANLFTGDVIRARAVARSGIARNRRTRKEAAIDLALLVAYVEEREGRFAQAIDAINDAQRLARKLGDPMLELASGLRAMRVNRVSETSPTETKDASHLVALAHRIGPHAFASRPAVLREAAAELGVSDPELLRWATDNALLDEILEALTADEAIGLLRIANSLTAEEEQWLRSLHGLERVKVVKKRVAERLYSTGLETQPLHERLQLKFQQSVEEILHRDFAPRREVGSFPPAMHSEVQQLATDPKLKRQFESVLTTLPESALQHIARHQLSTDLNRLGGRKSAASPAARLIDHALRLGRLVELAKATMRLAESSQLKQRFQRLIDTLELNPRTDEGTPAHLYVPNIQPNSPQPHQMHMSKKAPLRSLLTDVSVMNEIRGHSSTLQSARAAAGAEFLDRLIEGQADVITPGNYSRMEAIILLTGRPALMIQDGKWEEPVSREIHDRLTKAKDALLAAIPTVGRVEILDDARDYVGTGWMVDEDMLITNRHVAESFAAKRGETFSFKAGPDGTLYKARVDFRREHDRSGTAQAAVTEIIFLEERSDLRPDMALVRLDKASGVLPAPIELDTVPIKFRDQVAVIGYPAEDSRNDAFAMRDIFNDIYDVKRLSPGMVSGIRPDGKLLQHDCTTLGGNSGSLLVNLGTGKACGLHFSGSYREANYAVTAAWLKSRLAEVGAPQVAVGGLNVEGEERSRTPAAPDLTSCEGYNPEFLGEPNFAVALPEIAERLKSQVAAVTGSNDGELKYTHFSIRMRADRRLPFYTACNINGDLLFNFPRGTDRWFLDPRLVNQEHQIGESLYAGNPLDRGHLVRRLDPVWGDTRAEAKRAEKETFFFTNCTPQHSRLNQRTWLSLEDYVLSNAATHNLKLSVFTGPVMRDSDREYRGVLVPEEFWKVVLIVNSFTGQLSATGYILSQADYLTDLEFVYGEFRTYQVPIKQIEQKTELNFDLSAYDPLGRTEAKPQREVRGPSDMIL